MRGLEENEPHHLPYRQAHHRQRHRRRLLRNDSGSRHRRGDRHPGRGRYDRQPNRQHTLGLSRKHALELMIEMPYSDRIVRVVGTSYAPQPGPQPRVTEVPRRWLRCATCWPSTDGCHHAMPPRCRCSRARRDRGGHGQDALGGQPDDPLDPPERGPQPLVVMHRHRGPHISTRLKDLLV